jgi:hypothetical protein
MLSKAHISITDKYTKKLTKMISLILKNSTEKEKWKKKIFWIIIKNIRAIWYNSFSLFLVAKMKILEDLSSFLKLK